MKKQSTHYSYTPSAYLDHVKEKVDKQSRVTNSRGERRHLEGLHEDKVFKTKHPPVWFVEGSYEQEEWRRLLHLHQGGVDTLVVVDDDNNHVPPAFLEVDPAELGVQFILFSNTTRPVLTGGFAPQVRVYRQELEAADHEMVRFLAAVGGVGMLAGVKVILVTRDSGLKNAVLLLRGMRVVAAKSSVAHLVEYLHDRDQVRFSQ
ncbi:hypothetical protein DFQ26_009283 [Actinomortierella ambigua]|nr:hypothetical protein DFQ26_009283 [Actinomortierella ambigua]